MKKKRKDLLKNKKAKEKKTYDLMDMAKIFLCIYADIILILIVFKLYYYRKSDLSMIDKILYWEIEESNYTSYSIQDSTIYTIVIAPKEDFNLCHIQLIIKDSDEQIVYSHTITERYLGKDKSYTYRFEPLVEKPLSEYDISYQVTGKYN